MSTAIGTVYDDKVDADWVWCLRALEKHKGIVDLIRVPGGPGNFDVARNKVVAKFLEGTATHLLMVDTDMVFQPLDYKTLLGRGKSLISGAYVVADDPPRPCFAVRNEEGRLRAPQGWVGPGLVEVDALGCGFCLIRRDVFADIGSPKDNERFGPWFRQDLAGYAGQPLEPDYAFCQRAQAAGHKVYVDTNVKLGHIKPRALYG